MRTLITFLFALAVPVFAETALLKPRTWTSTDGVGLDAELIKQNKETITVKRTKDGRPIDIPLDRLSESDNEMLEAAGNSINVAAEKSVNKRYQEVQFLGLPDPGEATWELAKRLGKHQVLWEAMTQSSWRDAEGSQRLITLVPSSMKREQDNRYLVMGEHVAIRLEALAPNKMNISGDSLIIIDQNDRKKTLAERGRSFAPIARKDNLVSCDVEKIGINEILVITIRVSFGSAR
jgi:hypothetical protein